MGHKFLKHISRTKVNLFIVDVDGFQLGYKFHKRSAFETVVFLNKELELYDPNLVSKPSVLVINKMDTENAQDKLAQFLGQYKDYESKRWG
jgi:GTPase involved in cell partitioning and DNA repair